MQQGIFILVRDFDTPLAMRSTSCSQTAKPSNASSHWFVSEVFRSAMRESKKTAPQVRKSTAKAEFGAKSQVWVQNGLATARKLQIFSAFVVPACLIQRTQHGCVQSRPLNKDGYVSRCVPPQGAFHIYVSAMFRPSKPATLKLSSCKYSPTAAAAMLGSTLQKMHLAERNAPAKKVCKGMLSSFEPMAVTCVVFKTRRGAGGCNHQPCCCTTRPLTCFSKLDLTSHMQAGRSNPRDETGLVGPNFPICMNEGENTSSVTCPQILHPQSKFRLRPTSDAQQAVM